MLLIRADTPLESFLKVLEKLTKREHLRDVAIDVKDASVFFTHCPGHLLDTGFELQEIEDIISGEHVSNGLRYRYTVNPAQFKANGFVDWQYSSDSAPQIQAVKNLMEKGALKDKGFVTFWRPDRDMHRYIRRLDMGYTSDVRQRHPCGVVWHFSGVRGGMNVNVFNRSVWPLQSYSSDIHLPSAVAYYLGKVPKSFNMFVVGIKRSRGATANQLKNLVKYGTKYHDKIYSNVLPYKPSKTDDFKKVLAATEACRLGAFNKAHKIMEEFSKLSLYRDWVGAVAVTEYMMQRKALRGNVQYGVKSALQTKALKQAKGFTPRTFWESMNPRGVVTLTLAHKLAFHYAKRGDEAAISKVKRYVHPSLRSQLDFVVSVVKGDL